VAIAQKALSYAGQSGANACRAAGKLAIYEKAHLVVVSGSATGTGLPAAGPTVFNRTIVDDNRVDYWYPVISQLPGDLAWRRDYANRPRSRTPSVRPRGTGASPARSARPGDRRPHRRRGRDQHLPRLTGSLTPNGSSAPSIPRARCRSRAYILVPGRAERW